MNRKDYYAILGIPDDETQAGVKSAYRELAQRYHPDRAGMRSTRQFQDIAQAYHTLGDSERRARYDDDRRRERDRTGTRPGPDLGPGAEPLIPSPPAEPLIPNAPGRRRDVTWRMSIMDDFIGHRPSRDTLLGAFHHGFADAYSRKSGRADPLQLALVLSERDARRGALVSLGVPIIHPCALCHGDGHLWLATCRACGGRGRLGSEEIITLRIPPGCTDGQVLELALDRVGIQNLSLRVLVRVIAGGD